MISCLFFPSLFQVRTSVLPDHKEPRADVGVSNYFHWLIFFFSSFFLSHQQAQTFTAQQELTSSFNSKSFWLNEYNNQGRSDCLMDWCNPVHVFLKIFFNWSSPETSTTVQTPCLMTYKQSGWNWESGMALPQEARAVTFWSSSAGYQTFCSRSCLWFLFSEIELATYRGHIFMSSSTEHFTNVLGSNFWVWEDWNLSDNMDMWWEWEKLVLLGLNKREKTTWCRCQICLQTCKISGGLNF